MNTPTYLKKVEGLLGHDQIGVRVVVKVVGLQRFERLACPPLPRRLVQHPPGHLARRPPWPASPRGAALSGRHFQRLLFCKMSLMEGKYLHLIFEALGQMCRGTISIVTCQSRIHLKFFSLAPLHLHLELDRRQLTADLGRHD